MGKTFEQVAEMFLARAKDRGNGFSLVRLTDRQTAWLLDSPHATTEAQRRAARQRISLRGRSLKGDATLVKYIGRAGATVLPDGRDVMVFQAWYNLPVVLAVVTDSAADRAALDARIAAAQAEADARGFEF